MLYLAQAFAANWICEIPCISNGLVGTTVHELSSRKKYWVLYPRQLGRSANAPGTLAACCKPSSGAGVVWMS